MSHTLLPDYRELFQQEGHRQAVEGNCPLLLNDPQGVWLVDAERVEVFVVPLRDGQPAGSRVHLCRLEAGQLLFAVPGGAWGLMAVGLPGSTAVFLPLARLLEWAAERGAASVSAALENWVDRLTAGVTRGRFPQNPLLVAAGTEIRPAAATAVAPSQGLVWVSASAAARFLDRAEVVREVAFPLARSGWLSFPAAAALAAVDTETVWGQGTVWSGLSSFYRALLACVAAEVDEAVAADTHRLREKATAENQLMAGLVAQLAAVVEGGDTTITVAPGTQDWLLAAMQRVGTHAGIAIHPPRSFGQKRHTDPVGAIARASGVRVRRVLLSPGWWRKDSGPLVGFLGADGKPVAMLPDGAARYEIVDPVTHARTPLTRQTAARLQPHAYSLYRAFPAGALTARDLVQFSLRGTARDWLCVLVLGLAGGLLALLAPLATGLVFGRLIPGAERSQLLVIGLTLSLSAVTAALFEFTQGVAMLRLETRMDSAVEAGLWDRLLNLPASFFRQYTAGDLADRAMGVGLIRQLLTQSALSTLLTFAFSLVSFGLLFYFDVRLALLASVLFMIIVAATAVGALVQLRFERSRHQLHGRVSGLVLQLLSGISRLRVAAAENRALACWTRQFRQKTRLAYRAQSVANVLATFMAALPVISSLAIFAAVSLGRTEPMSLGVFLAFNAAFVQVIIAAVSMSGTLSAVLEVIPLCERAQPILTTPPESHRVQRDPGELTGDIEISHVSFRYQPDSPLVLDDVTITVRPGEFVALVGPSGAGKSTILRLLLGFETCTAGSVYYDREDLAGLDLQALRRQIGVVLQSHRLTPGDLLTNITGGAPQYTLDDAWEAARQCGLEADIRQMPMGMYTVVSEAEATLSGGQRQRLMIARAIIAKPRILLFDEATSALDNTTQAKVTESLARLKATRIVVAHRLSTILGADRIYVLDRGRVVQQGTSAELMAQPGLFADLAKRQLL